jgi:hypothetical protein
LVALEAGATDEGCGGAEAGAAVVEGSCVEDGATDDSDVVDVVTGPEAFLIATAVGSADVATVNAGSANEDGGTGAADVDGTCAAEEVDVVSDVVVDATTDVVTLEVCSAVVVEYGTPLSST